MTTLQIIGLIVVALLGLYVFYCIYDLGKTNKKKEHRQNKVLTVLLTMAALFAGLQTPSYTFTAKTTDYASRFKLVFSANENDNENEDFAFISNGEIFVNGTGILQVVDVFGHQLISRQVNSDFRLLTSRQAFTCYD